MDTTLIIMAAGIGSRFGTGIKQLAKMASNGEISDLDCFWFYCISSDYFFLFRSYIGNDC